MQENDHILKHAEMKELGSMQVDTGSLGSGCRAVSSVLSDRERSGYHEPGNND